MLRHGFGDAANRSSLTAMAYKAGWNATDQIPQRAVDMGLIGRFGTLDASDGGNTSRYSLSYTFEGRRDDGELRVNAYAVRSALDLYSNFSFFLENPIDLDPAALNGDQFQQTERRKLFGLAASRRWDTTLFGRDATHTLGAQLRHDRLDPVGLYSTVARQRAAVTQESVVRQTSLGFYADSAVQWTPWLRSVAGLRADRFAFDVRSSIPANSGKTDAGIVSPKLSLIFGPWHGPWFGQFQLRHFGPRPLVEDNSQRSRGTTLASLRAGYRVNERVRLALDVFNLFDRQGSNIDYHYTSRLKGEPAEGVNDIHFHPVEPRSVRLTLSAAF